MTKVAFEKMRNIDGGYRLRCTRCGKKSGSVGPIGVTAFYAKHKHYSFKNKYVIWDYSYRNADKWYS